LDYDQVESHAKECQFTQVKCTNFGCGQKVQLKDFQKHQEECSFRVQKCSKCQTITKEGEEHDCIESLCKRFEAMEKQQLALKKIQEAKEAEPKSSLKVVRYEIMLPSMASLFFQPHMGLSQTVSEELNDLPPGIKALVIKFALTDLNLRRQYTRLLLRQKGSS